MLKDGWYTTGDVGMIEEDGFVTITDRLSRFSKIEGEMVPHIRIEEKLHELADRTEQTFAVTAAADERKGERIILIHTLPEDKLAPGLETVAVGSAPVVETESQSVCRCRFDPDTGYGKDGTARHKNARG